MNPDLSEQDIAELEAVFEQALAEIPDAIKPDATVRAVLFKWMHLGALWGFDKGRAWRPDVKLELPPTFN